MIRETANNLLKLLRENSGFEKEVFSNNNMDVLKLIDLVLSECRCSIVDEKGNYSRFGSSTDIRIIKVLVQNLMSNSCYLEPEIVSMALTKEGVIGPFKKIDIKKLYDQNTGKYDIEIEDIFPNEFNVNMFQTDMDLREKFLDLVIKPYVKNIIFENDVLMKKSPFLSYINKYLAIHFHPLKKNEELVKVLSEILKSKIANEDEEIVDNISNYIFINIMNNKYFKAELIDRTLGTTELQKLGKISVSFNSLVNNMGYETLQMIELRSFPYGEIFAIKDTFLTLVAVLEALSLNFENVDENEILNKIAAINVGFNISIKDCKDCNVKYRTKNVEKSKFGNMVFVNPDDIKIALMNVCKMIKVLLMKKDEIDEEAFIYEVLRIQYRLLRIQPFERGNGRTIRAITNILLQSKGLIGIFRKEKKKDFISFVEAQNKQLKDIEEKYVESLVNNPIECNDLERFVDSNNLPFIIVKG